MQNNEGHHAPPSVEPGFGNERRFIQDKIYDFLMQRQQNRDIGPKNVLVIVTHLEEGLLKSAKTKEEYMSLETLKNRLHALIKRPINNHNQRYQQQNNPSVAMGIRIPTLRVPQSGNSNSMSSSSADNMMSSAVNAGSFSMNNFGPSRGMNTGAFGSNDEMDFDDVFGAKNYDDLIISSKPAPNIPSSPARSVNHSTYQGGGSNPVSGSNQGPHHSRSHQEISSTDSRPLIKRKSAASSARKGKKQKKLASHDSGPVVQDLSESSLTPRKRSHVSNMGPVLERVAGDFDEHMELIESVVDGSLLSHIREGSRRTVRGARAKLLIANLTYGFAELKEEEEEEKLLEAAEEACEKVVELEKQLKAAKGALKKAEAAQREAESAQLASESARLEAERKARELEQSLAELTDARSSQLVPLTDCKPNLCHPYRCHEVDQICARDF